MAQFRSTADILDLALQKAGEVTNGNSPYETQALNYLNRVHFALIAGGTIPVGKDELVEIDEVWPWARSVRPIILELEPRFDTGTVTLTQGSEQGTFSSAPSVSVAGWYLKVSGKKEIFRIASHTASATAFELDGLYSDDSGTLNFRALKLDYDVIPDYIVIDTTNNKLDFRKAALGTILTATLTAGTYAPADLITHVATQVTAAAGGPTITGSYSALTKKFTLTSDGAAASLFQPMFATGTNQPFSVHKTLGFDDQDLTGALTYSSTYILGGICRMMEPIKIHKSYLGSIFGMDPETYQRDCPLNQVEEGNPDRFTVLSESPDGTQRIRVNRYVKEKTRIEIEHVPVPRDLKDSAGSIPLVPRKHIDVLEDAATFYIMLDKSDDRQSKYAELLKGKLKAMISQNRGTLARTGESFAELTPRRDNLRLSKRRFDREGGYT